MMPESFTRPRRMASY